MKVNPGMFRGYDLRGVVGKDLSPEIAYHLGMAFGTYLSRSGQTKALVGRDSRETGPEYSQKLIEGLRWAGINVTDIGMQLVGTFYWSQHHLKIPGGVYVSASHNPPNYNGFKFGINYSETLVTEGMNEMRRLVQEEDYDVGKTKGSLKSEDIEDDYFEDVLSKVEVKKNYKVVIDPSCTTAGAFAPKLLRKLGMEVVEYNTNIDSSFPLGTADPTETHVIDRLSKEVLESSADVGFTYDADGDRIGIVDENGVPIWNDMLVAIFASDVLIDHPGATIMYNLYCSNAVRETIENKGGKPFMWRVGHSFLKKKNQEVKAAFIGELSGHFFFSKDFYNHDDGLFSTLRVLQYMSRSGKTLSELAAELPSYVSSPEIKVGIDDDKKINFINKLSERLSTENSDALVIDDERAGDGLRIEFVDNSMFVIRYSQNGPYCGMKFEAKTDKRYSELKDYIRTTLESYDEIDFDSEMSGNLEAIGIKS